MYVDNLNDQPFRIKILETLAMLVFYVDAGCC